MSATSSTSMEELARVVGGRVRDAAARVEFLEEALASTEAAALRASQRERRARAKLEAAMQREREASELLEASAVRESELRDDLEATLRASQAAVAADRRKVAAALKQMHAGAAQTSSTTTLRLAASKSEAASILGVSVDFFDDHVAHELACVRRGRRRLYPLRELERWLDQAAERAFRPRS